MKKCANIGEAVIAAKLWLVRQAIPSPSETTGVARLFILKQENGVIYVIPRHYKMHGSTIKEKLILVSGKTHIGKLLMNDAHIHCSDISFELAKLYQKGYFVTHARSYFRKLQKDCFTCRRIRKASVQALMGANIQLQAAKNVHHLLWCSWTAWGTLKQKFLETTPGKFGFLSSHAVGQDSQFS